MKIDTSILSALLATLTPPAVFFLAVIWDRHQRNHTEKPPQTEKLLRPPGYSLSIRLDKTFDSILDNLFAACLLSIFSSAALFVLAVLFDAKAPVKWQAGDILFAMALVAGCVACVVRAFRRFKEAQNIRLGLRGEQAVAEALNEASGFRAFHDMPGGDDWNIDHVAVGTRGVLDTCPVTPLFVFRPVLAVAGACLILVHNHPSGDPTASEADIKVTRDLIRAGQLLKIEILDHVIVGAGEQFQSLKAMGNFY